MVRHGAFPFATGLKVFRVLATLFFSLCFLGLVIGLVWAAALAYVLSAVLVFYACSQRGWSIKKISQIEIFNVARTHVKFPAQSALPAFFDNLSMLIPVYLATSLYGADDVGQWGLTRMVLALPMAMIAGAMAQVLMKKLHDMLVQHPFCNFPEH
ncbi:MAG: hypothetical protein HEQ17_12410 [Limnohabitans sp.]|uniref:hypothetical protein n=1 Tax=Limnohabitans sp. TaxID=1907725 RepID=UPI0025F53F81|nr:hypothetical protein [Limnohabitans sp.]MCO4089687.1 hypothetical protein [Limnohabitans sp.]